MVSPEVLRHYPFFANFDDTMLDKLAGMVEEIHFHAGDILYATGDPNAYLFMVEEGRVESFLVIEDPRHIAPRQEAYLFDLDQSEMLGLSAMVERQNQTTTARAAQDGKLIRLNAEDLIALCDAEPALGYAMMREIALTQTERLQRGFFCNRCPRAIADQLEQIKSGTVTGGRVLT